MDDNKITFFLKPKNDLEKTIFSTVEHHFILRVKVSFKELFTGKCLPVNFTMLPFAASLAQLLIKVNIDHGKIIYLHYIITTFLRAFDSF